MNKDFFYERLSRVKKIASVKEPKYIEKALNSDLGAIVLSIGNIAVIKRYVDLFKAQDFPVFLHIERLGGISQDREGIDFLAHYVKPTGIVSTRNSLIKEAKKQGLLTIQRLFLIDSDALKTGLQSAILSESDKMFAFRSGWHKWADVVPDYRFTDIVQLVEKFAVVETR